MPGDYSRKTFNRSKHYSGVLMQQGRVQLDADWNEQLDIQLCRIETEAVDVIGRSGVPQETGGFKIGIAPGGRDLTISPGRIYVDGILCELETPATYTSQPYYPNPDFTVPGGSPPSSPPGGALQLVLEGATYLVFLDVWQREVTALDDRLIREVALGGPDTTTRLQNVYQVRLLKVAPASPPQAINCETAIADFDQFTALSTGKLNARTRPPTDDENLCLLPPSAGYSRLENQLYRVEIQQTATNQVTFKWSRDNASIETRIEKIEDNVLTVVDVGKDEVLGFAAGQWVEIVDDESTFNGAPRPLLQIDTVDPASREITLTVSAQDRANLTGLKLRRWDQVKDAGPDGVAISAGNWIDLEGGIQVNFSAGTYRAGDYWLIPARTLTGEIEWPPFEIPNTQPIEQSPRGIHHHYCRLGIIEVDDNGVIDTVSDCRNVFPPLTELEQLLYVSGDGQDGIPGRELPQPLIVRVARGDHPVSGAPVGFEIETGNGSLVGGSPPKIFRTSTDGDGIASCRWILDGDIKAAARFQRVRASRLDDGGQPRPGERIVFCATATLSLQYVSGDGQQGQAGNQLAHPLEVRVANGQTPIPNARIRFSAVQGGGVLAGTNPALTTSNGIASINWQLGASGPQRVQAEMIDGAGTAVQILGFNADIAGPASGGGGCEITVGEGGQIKQLNTETLNKLLETLKGAVCLCFMPGDHVIDDLRVTGNDNSRLSIHGCGHASRLNLKKPAELAGFSSVEISNLTVLADGGCGFLFGKCSEVRICGIQAEIAAPSDRPFLEFAAITQTIAVTENRIRTKFPGLSVVFDDAAAVTHCTGNSIDGIVSFYGAPTAGATQVVNFGPLAQRLPNVVLQATSGRLSLSNNHLELMTIGSKKIAELNAVAAGQQTTITGLYAGATLQGNTITAPNNLFTSRFLSLNGSAFLGSAQLLGVMVAEGAAAAGNVASAISDALQLVIVARKNVFGQAGNAVFILNP